MLCQDQTYSSGREEEAKKALLHIVGRPEWRGKPAYIEALFYLGRLFFLWREYLDC